METLISAIADTLPDTPFKRLDVHLGQCLKPVYGKIICGFSPRSTKEDKRWLLGLLGPPSYIDPGQGLVWHFVKPPPSE